MAKLSLKERFYEELESFLANIFIDQKWKFFIGIFVFSIWYLLSIIIAEVIITGRVINNAYAYLITFVFISLVLPIIAILKYLFFKIYQKQILELKERIQKVGANNE